MKALLGTLAAIATASTIWCSAVTLVLAAKFSYPWFSAGAFNSHDLSPEQMQANYDAVIDYSLFPWVRELQLPHLPMSDAGVQHFAEAKEIFQIFVQGSWIGLLLAVLLGVLYWRRYRTAGFLTAGGIIALATPAALAIPLAVNFERAFVVFHEIAFNNDLWIFDPAVDPIINYLPEALFMRNAFAILALMLLLAAVAIVAGRRLGRRVRRQTQRSST